MIYAFIHDVLKKPNRKFGYVLVMCRTPFFRTSNELEHHFSNIERTRTCSSIGDRTRTPYFWLRTIEHRTSNIVRTPIDAHVRVHSMFEK